MLSLLPGISLSAQGKVDFDLSFLVRRGAVVSAVENVDPPYGQEDRFRIVVRPHSRGYYYILFDAADGKLNLLYPSPSGLGTALDARGAVASYPPDDTWFALDGAAGTDRLYVVVTYADEPALVSAIRENLRRPSAATRFKVLEEVRRISQKEHSAASTFTTPIAILGPIRSPIAGLSPESVNVRSTSDHVEEFDLPH